MDGIPLGSSSEPHLPGHSASSMGPSLMAGEWTASAPQPPSLVLSSTHDGDIAVARPPLATRRSAGSSSFTSGESNNLLKAPISPLSSPSLASPGLTIETPSLASTKLPSYLDEGDQSTITRETSHRSIPPAWLGTSSAPVSLSSEMKLSGHHGDGEALKRDYDTFSLFGLTVANLGFLQGTLFGAVSTSAFGGASMFSIGWPITGLFMCCVSAIMAELASAFPVAGAMMTWTFRLARSIPQLRSSARFLSWLVGSYLLCAHVLTQVLLAYQLGTVIQGTIHLYHPDYTPSSGAVAGVSLAVLCLAVVVVLSTVSRSPWLWKAVFIEIIVAYLIMVISLGSATNVPLLSANYVFTNYSNETGFSSAPMVYLIGWVQTCLATGQDAAVHMAEETKNPSRAAPWAIFWATFISYVLGWVAICVILAASRPVPLSDNALPHTSLFAPGELLDYHLPQGLATVIIVLLLVAMFFQNVAQLLASSRYCWALARDNALPLSSLIKRVSSDRIPRFAILFVAVCVIPGILLVALIQNVVTTVALQGAGFTILLAYAVPIVLYIRAGPNALDFDGRRQFSLRRLSIPVAILSVLFLCLAVIVFCFPTGYPVDIYSLSWSPVILGGVFILSCISWILYGNYHYAGPIKAVLGPDVELPRFSGVRSQATQAINGTGPGVAGTEKRPSEPGTTKVFFASGIETATMAQTMTDTQWSAGRMSTRWEEEDEDEVITDDDEGAQATPKASVIR